MAQDWMDLLGSSGLSTEELKAVTGLLQPSAEDKSKAMNMGLLQAGLGVLAHNTNKYNPWPAIGQGGMIGLGAYQQQIDKAEADKMKSLQAQQLIGNLKDAAMKRKLLQELTGQQSNISPAQQALSQGAQAGSVGPTVENASRLQQVQANSPVNALSKLDPNVVKLELLYGKGDKLGAMLNDITKPNMQMHNGRIIDMNKVQPGFQPGMTVSANGQALLTKVGPDGNPSVSAAPGASGALAEMTGAQELAKAKMTPAEVEYNGRKYSTTLDVKTTIETGVAPDEATARKTALWADYNKIPIKQSSKIETPEPVIAPTGAATEQSKLLPGQSQTEPEKIKLRTDAETRAKWDAEKPQATTSLQMKMQAADRLAESADALLKHKYLGFSTGVTAISTLVPGTPMYDVGSKLESLKAKISIDALAQMREASKTGGALGNVSNFEDQMLANSVAALQKAQTLPAVRESLSEIKKWAQQAKDRTAEQYKSMYGTLPKSNSASSNIDSLLEKYK